MTAPDVTGFRGLLLRLSGRRRSSRLRPPVIPLVILATVAIAGLTAQWIAPYDPIKGALQLRNLPPFWAEGGSLDYLLGTDHLGRDLLSRLIYGARISLSLAVAAMVIGGSVGTFLGLVSGWYGGWVDELIMRIADIFLAIPLVLITLVFTVVFGASFLLIMVVLVSFLWVRFARVVRGEVLRLKHLDHVALAKVAGASTLRILFRHILPGVRNTLIVVATLQIGVLILLESTLSFLGAGVPSPTASWGSMVADGRSFMASAWWISTIPGVAILLTLLAFNLLGEWLRDVFDPRAQ